MIKTLIILRRILRAITRTFYVASMGALFFMAAAILYDVTLRAVFKKPTYWTVEVTSVLLVIIAFLGAADLLRQDKHIRFSLLLDRLSPASRHAAELVNSLFGMVFCLVLAWQGGSATQMVYVNNMRMPSITATPLYIPYLCMSVGALLLALQFLLKILDQICGIAGEGGADDGR